jgi:predicted molibdopterin-dependent oxidoreductase YjgC
MPMMEAAARGEIDFLYNVGGNLFAVLPDPNWVREAFDKVKVRIHQDIVFNTSTVLEGDVVLVLPAQTRYEQRGGGTSTSTERRVRFSPEIPGHPQVGECRPEWEIPAQIAAAAFPKRATQLGWRDAGEIRVEMDVAMPLYKGIAGLKQAGDWIQWGGPYLFADLKFPMPDGRARFTVLEPVRIEVPDGHLYLTTRRGKQFNSIVIKDHDPVQGGKQRDDLLISGADLVKLGMEDGERARLVNETGTFDVTLRKADIRPGVVQAYWPECNVVIGRRIDPRSEEPDYNAVVRVERA